MYTTKNKRTEPTRKPNTKMSPSEIERQKSRQLERSKLMEQRSAASVSARLSSSSSLRERMRALYRSSRDADERESSAAVLAEQQAQASSIAAAQTLEVVQTYRFCDSSWLKPLGVLGLCPGSFPFESMNAPKQTITVDPAKPTSLDRAAVHSTATEYPTIFTTIQVPVTSWTTEYPTVWTTLTVPSFVTEHSTSVATVTEPHTTTLYETAWSTVIKPVTQTTTSTKYYSTTTVERETLLTIVERIPIPTTTTVQYLGTEVVTLTTTIPEVTTVTEKVHATTTISLNGEKHMPGLNDMKRHGFGSNSYYTADDLRPTWLRDEWTWQAVTLMLVLIWMIWAVLCCKCPSKKFARPNRYQPGRPSWPSRPSQPSQPNQSSQPSQPSQPSKPSHQADRDGQGFPEDGKKVPLEDDVQNALDEYIAQHLLEWRSSQGELDEPSYSRFQTFMLCNSPNIPDWTRQLVNKRYMRITWEEFVAAGHLNARPAPKKDGKVAGGDANADHVMKQAADADLESDGKNIGSAVTAIRRTAPARTAGAVQKSGRNGSSLSSKGGRTTPVGSSTVDTSGLKPETSRQVPPTTPKSRKTKQNGSSTDQGSSNESVSSQTKKSSEPSPEQSFSPGAIFQHLTAYKVMTNYAKEQKGAVRDEVEEFMRQADGGTMNLEVRANDKRYFLFMRDQANNAKNALATMGGPLDQGQRELLDARRAIVGYIDGLLAQAV